MERCNDAFRSISLGKSWFGGKTLAAPLIWERMGNVPNYLEPFAGALATLLHRPHAPGIETVNELDGFVCNVWRSLAADPEATATHATWLAHECDLHARHLWLRAHRQALTERLMGDPSYYDAKIAGWWLWGIAHWIGGGWCGDSGSGPWGLVHDVRAWCLAHGQHPLLRIVLCGYGDTHDALVEQGWTKVAWKAHGGMGNQSARGRGRDNATRERLWCSPHCLIPAQGDLFP